MDESAIEGANGDGSDVIIGAGAGGAVALLTLVVAVVLFVRRKKKRSASAGGGQVQVTMTQPGQSKEVPPSLESKVDTKPGDASASAAGKSSSDEPKKQWF
eukprot:scaffold75928_cov66-Phaeocystis_antarctica.AAC.1